MNFARDTDQEMTRRYEFFYSAVSLVWFALLALATGIGAVAVWLMALIFPPKGSHDHAIAWFLLIIFSPVAVGLIAKSMGYLKQLSKIKSPAVLVSIEGIQLSDTVIKWHDVIQISYSSRLGGQCFLTVARKTHLGGKTEKVSFNLNLLSCDGVRAAIETYYR